MRHRHFSFQISLSLVWIRFVSFVLCYTLVSPCMVVMSLRTSASASAGKQSIARFLPNQPSPTPTPADGEHQMSSGPYVPPALRTDNSERRANGKEGKRVEPLPVKRGVPGLNLPDLGESRKTRKSPVTKSVSAVASEESVSSASLQSEAAPIECGDCNPGGGAGGPDPYFGAARTRPINRTGIPGVNLGSRNFNWSLPLVSLPGRSGLDVSISLFYNSLVWTQQGSAIQYNADHGTPAPGFQIGLPRLQAQFFRRR